MKQPHLHPVVIYRFKSLKLLELHHGIRVARQVAWADGLGQSG